MSIYIVLDTEKAQVKDIIIRGGENVVSTKTEAGSAYQI